MGSFRAIVSGGQTGADRAALDVAIRHVIPHRGWCPRGRRAEDGAIDERYRLTETPDADYLQRTAWNVRDADGTAVFTLAAEADGGSLATIGFALEQGKPCLHLSRADRRPPVPRLREFVRAHGIAVLNVAGSRESKEPGIHHWTAKVLEEALLGGDRR